ncbi:flagellar biosynthetic protein FliO [Roseiflexus sp. AH-315-K22]|nr:flagellar biosynthetic protein FliO [Roseiflexus sp. AH-315-K22]
MFTAARIHHANNFALLGMTLVLLGVVGGAARAQDHDVLGPPMYAPPVAKPDFAPVRDEQPSVPVGEETDRAAQNTGAVGGLDAPQAPGDSPKKISPGVSNSLTGSRSLGALPQSARRSVDETGGAAVDPASSKNIGKTAGATAIVLALIILIALAIRAIARRQGGLMAAMGPGGRSPGGLLEVLGRFPIGRGQTLVLLKIDRRVLLLSQSSGGRLGAGASMNTLCEITDPEEVASILIKGADEGGDSMAHRFRSLLAGQSNIAPLRDEPVTAGRAVFENDAGDSTEIWDESQGFETITERAETWPTGPTGPTGHDSSALGSLKSRLEHWRDVEAKG